MILTLVDWALLQPVFLVSFQFNSVNFMIFVVRYFLQHHDQIKMHKSTMSSSISTTSSSSSNNDGLNDVMVMVEENLGSLVLQLLGFYGKTFRFDQLGISGCFFQFYLLNIGWWWWFILIKSSFSLFLWS